MFKALSRLLVLITPLLIVLPAGAADDKYAAPELDQVPWLAILCAVIFLVIVGAVAFKNSGRTHLD